ncbi:MAG: gliding motility protein GldN [Salibacteraceae bacterium]
MIRKISLILGLGVLSNLGMTQVLDPGQESPLDGVYSKSIDTPHKKPVPYVQLREADIMWLQRVWRTVDMREKVNHSFYFPLKPTQGRKNFMQVVMDAIAMERIHAYASYDSTEGGTQDYDDTFKLLLTAEEAKNALSFKEQIEGEDEFGDATVEEIVSSIGLEEITSFRIKEEVFFDKQRSLMETRILGIAPLIPDKVGGDESVMMEAFWIYFPEARFVFAEAEVYNRHNDVDRLTYEELFWKRKFNSRIIKVSNVYDRSIDQYKSPMDALLEAEKIEDEIFNREHDMWSF